MHIASRLPHVGTTIFTTMSLLAQESGAINLGQGFPSFSPPQPFVDYISEAVQAGHHQYAPMEGLMSLRQAIVAKLQRCYGATLDPASEITVTSGGTEALFCAIAASISAPGDEVMLLQPCYDSYGPAVLLNGGVPVYVDLSYPTFRPDWEAIRAAITPRTKALLLNTPHNPTGTIWTAEDMAELQRLCTQHNIFLIADEVYEHMVFDGADHLSLLRYPDLYARAFVVHSFGKTYHATGWKMGYVAAPPSLSKELRKVHQFVTFCSFTPVQHALARILEHQDHYNSLPAFYEQKRNALLHAFQHLPLTPIACQGTYFQLFDYSAISQEGDQDFARRLAREAGVASIPVSSFYHNGHDQQLLRFCFAKDEGIMLQAAERIGQWISQQ